MHSFQWFISLELQLLLLPGLTVLNRKFNRTPVSQVWLYFGFWRHLVATGGNKPFVRPRLACIFMLWDFILKLLTGEQLCTDNQASVFSKEEERGEELSTFRYELEVAANNFKSILTMWHPVKRWSRDVTSYMKSGHRSSRTTTITTAAATTNTTAATANAITTATATYTNRIKIFTWGQRHLSSVKLCEGSWSG